MPISLKHASLVQLGQVFRERFREARGLEAGKLSRWILNRITDGTFTDTQVRNFFGLTVTQYNQLKTRLQEKASRYDAVIQDSGE